MEPPRTEAVRTASEPGEAAILALLGNHPYFTGLPTDLIAEIRRHAVVRRYARGAMIFCEDEPPLGLYVLAAGSVRVYKASANGRELDLFHIAPGESFNDGPAFDGGPTFANAEATEPATVIVIRVDALWSVMRRTPAFAMTVVQGLATRLRGVSGLVAALALRDISSRIAALLLGLATQDGTIDLPTRRELATKVGTVREVVTRAIRDLERSGIVRLEDSKRVVILDRVRLRTLAGLG